MTTVKTQLINIVLDLETLSLQEDAAILQIGCCIPQFDRVKIPEGISHEFEVTVAYDIAVKSEFHKDSETMDWWEKQDPRVRKLVFSGQNNYEDALHQLVFWLDNLRLAGADIAIWGNGSDFDNRLLTYTLNCYGFKKCWDFRNNRDLRTLKALFPLEGAGITLVRTSAEIAHTALGDARYEARVLDITRSVCRNSGIIIL